MTSRPMAVRCLFVCVATLLTFSASASAQTSEWTVCAPENGFCAFSGTQEVRYGANGSYYYQVLSDGTACSNGVFGDPLVGTFKNCAVRASDWTFCASEYGFCAFSGTQEVRYGANGSYYYQVLSDGTACSNSVFGDPVAGTVKNCAVRASDWTFCASEGGFCAFSGTRAVRYGANGAYYYQTLSGGTACTNSVFGDPIAGTVKQCHIGGASAAPPPPAAAAVGPQPTITCPAGAVDIWPGVNVQSVVNSYGGNTAFCLRAGTHAIRSAITPKTGNTFVGEYGAVLDGTGWTTTDSTQGAFRSHNQDIDNVTIRNLVIRNMPQKAIHGFYWMSDAWTVEYTEMAANKYGIQFPNRSTIRNNYIHHNVGANPLDPNPSERGGAYIGYYARDTTFENNEIAYNGREQKVMESVNVTFRNNFVHHNIGDGIWYDGGSAGAVVEGNRVEDSGREGIFLEASNDVIVRNNTVRRSGITGVFISVSQSIQIYNNTLEHNFRGITYFIYCGALSAGRNLDLQNNAAHDNTIRVGTQSGALASALSYSSDCTSTQLAPYLNGAKNLTFSRNAYSVPSVTGWYWYWATHQQWPQWQALGHDTTSTVQ